MLVAQMVGGGLGGIAITVIILLALCAIVYVAALAMKLPIPSWLIQIVGIVVIACVAIIAIKFVLSL